MIKRTERIQSLAEDIVAIHNEYFFKQLLSGVASVTDFLKDPLVLQSLSLLIDKSWDELFDTVSNPYWNRSDISDSDHSFILHSVQTQISSITQDLLNKHWIALLDKEITTYNEIKAKLQSAQTKLTPFPQIPSASFRNELLHNTLAYINQSDKLERYMIILRTLPNSLPLDIKTFVQVATSSESPSSEEDAKIMDSTQPISQEESKPNQIIEQNPLHNEKDYANIMNSTQPESKPAQISEQIPLNTALPTGETKDALQLSETKHDQPDIAIFKRQKLVGGSIHDKKTNEIITFIPESVIKKLDLKHGDSVKITERHKGGKVTIEIHEKHPEDSNWVEMEYCIVSKQNSGGQHKYVIKEMILNGEKQAIPDQTVQCLEIKEIDLAYYKLDEGDIVNIAYWKGRIDLFRVIWKHRM